MIKITYFDTLYHTTEFYRTDHVDVIHGDGDYKDWMVVFKALGRKHAIPMEHIISIEPINED